MENEIKAIGKKMSPVTRTIIATGVVTFVAVVAALYTYDSLPATWKPAPKTA